MELPTYWMPRPGPLPDSEARADFDELLNQVFDQEPGRPIEYRLRTPKWQFLCHAAEHAQIVLHGSGDPNIEWLEPRQAADVLGFSSRRAVYATTDGVLPVFFAIVDRDCFPMTLLNACIRLGAGPEQLSDSYYFFSISDSALRSRPWRDGTVYLLSADGFEYQPTITVGEATIHVAQATSPVPVRPLAKLTVRPHDFPFLRDIRGHDDDLLDARFAADPEGFPWVSVD